MVDNGAAPAPSLLPARTAWRGRYDEANVSRLGLISIQERIPEDYTSWSVGFFRDGRPSRLQCVASAEYGGVPHGLDGDVVTALTDLYIERGAPENGRVRTSAYALLKRAGFSDSGHYYAALKRSLQRLRLASYSASECWRDAERERWITVTFTYLAGLNFSADEDLPLGRSSELEVRLAEPVVRSIRASYLKPLDYDFLRSLSRPPTRALFRLLDARRYDPLNLDEVWPSIQVGLIDWAQDCKLSSLAPDKIRRSLRGAHQELTERGYLSSVTYQGKGRQQTVVYQFQTHLGMGPQRLRIGEQILDNGLAPKNSGAFLVDVIEDAAGKDETAAVLPGAQAKAVQAGPQQADPPDGAHRPGAEEAPKTPAEPVADAFSLLKLVLHPAFSAAEYAQLERYLSLPDVDAEALGREALNAKRQGATIRFTHKVRTLVGIPSSSGTQMYTGIHQRPGE